MEDAGLRELVTALEERVGRLEDQLAIHRLINSWGPAVDTGQAEVAAGLFSDDAVLTSDMSHLVGPAAIEEMVHSDGQQALIRQGSAHIPAFPLVDIDGDAARAIGYSRVYLHTDAGYEVLARVSQLLGVPKNRARLACNQPDQPHHRRRIRGAGATGRLVQATHLTDKSSIRPADIRSSEYLPGRGPPTPICRRARFA